MNKFWYWAVEFLPMWMAPNLVTLIGFSFMLSMYGAFMLYDETFSGDIPMWVFFWGAFCIFAY